MNYLRDCNENSTNVQATRHTCVEQYDIQKDFPTNEYNK